MKFAIIATAMGIAAYAVGMSVLFWFEWRARQKELKQKREQFQEDLKRGARIK